MQIAALRLTLPFGEGRLCKTPQHLFFLGTWGQALRKIARSRDVFSRMRDLGAEAKCPTRRL